MVKVEPLFRGAGFKTEVLISRAAKKELLEYVKKVGSPRFLHSLKTYATVGFSTRISGNGPIKHEWNGVFRIGDRSLFRLIGFFDGVKDERFVIIDAFLKTGQGLAKPQRDRIDTVAEVKRGGFWREEQP